MQSIYCCGNHGAVGFVSGWDFAETDSTRIADVHLTLNINDAYTFDRSDESQSQRNAVLQYLMEAAVVYGTVEVLGREEP